MSVCCPKLTSTITFQWMEVEASYYMLNPFRKTSQNIKITVILTFPLILNYKKLFELKYLHILLFLRFLLHICILILNWNGIWTRIEPVGEPYREVCLSPWKGNWRISKNRIDWRNVLLSEKKLLSWEGAQREWKHDIVYDPKRSRGP